MTTQEQDLEPEAKRQIARRFVTHLKRYVGRGPTSARVYFRQNLVVVVLEQTLTRVEQTLAEENRIQLVRELRRAFQAAMRDRLEQIIEEETGLRVRASLGDHAVDPDIAIDAFVLEPDEPTRSNGKPIAALSSRQDPAPELERAISRGMVTLFKDYAGRGPTETRAYIHDELIVVLLEDTLTMAERSLARDDQGTMVREIRRQFQGAMREAAVALVEEQLERRVVRAFLSDSSVRPDYAIEVFLLADRDRAGAAS